MTTTIDIPDGWAILRDPEDITERGRRLLQTALVPLQSVFRKTNVPAELRKAAEGKGKAAEAAQAKIERLSNESMTTRQEAASAMEVRDAAVVALLQEWSRDEPLPTIDNLLDLDRKTFDALTKGTAPFVKDVLAASRPTSFEPAPGRDTPFDESSTSSTGSSAPGIGSTGKRRNTGRNTSTRGTSAPA